MTGTPIDLATWSRAEQFRFFRGFERPHFAITARVDATRLMQAKADAGLSVFRTCLWAVGAGLNAVPEARMRFRGDDVTLYDRFDLSPTIALPSGDFAYTYIPWQSDRAAFDTEAARRIAALRDGAPLSPNDGADKQDVAYLSCVPWLDYTALGNAMPDARDCIPRVGWGRIVPTATGHDMAMTVEVHHALMDGRHAAQVFAATQEALDTL